MSAVVSMDEWRTARRRSPVPAPVPVPASEGPLRLTRRGRVVLTVLVLGLMALVVLWGGKAFASGPGEPREVTVHAVQAGETLWQHAAALAGGDRDVRDVVDELMALNGLSSASLEVGQQLLLPVGKG
ncbi:LysM peptidoglycan-binding domain-containing protein [Oerskovia enterophila]|uniref:LysM peptidoglycan-binding domain-containing protein n=1 Tax=Oerskovia enterophila TaxID=43678 RepID=UPI0033940AD1